MLFLHQEKPSLLDSSQAESEACDYCQLRPLCCSRMEVKLVYRIGRLNGGKWNKWKDVVNLSFKLVFSIFRVEYKEDKWEQGIFSKGINDSINGSTIHKLNHVKRYEFVFLSLANKEKLNCFLKAIVKSLNHSLSSCKHI